MEDKLKLFKKFKSATNKVIKLFSVLEDRDDLTEEEKKELLKNYDVMTVHSSISIEQLQGK